MVEVRDRARKQRTLYSDDRGSDLWKGWDAIAQGFNVAVRIIERFAVFSDAPTPPGAWGMLLFFYQFRFVDPRNTAKGDFKGNLRKLVAMLFEIENTPAQTGTRNKLAGAFEAFMQYVTKADAAQYGFEDDLIPAADMLEQNGASNMATKLRSAHAALDGIRNLYATVNTDAIPDWNALV